MSPRISESCCACCSCWMTSSLALSISSARDLFISCVRSSWHLTATPVGMCLIRTAVSTCIIAGVAGEKQEQPSWRRPRSARQQTPALPLRTHLVHVLPTGAACPGRGDLEVGLGDDQVLGLEFHREGRGKEDEGP